MRFEIPLLLATITMHAPLAHGAEGNFAGSLYSRSCDVPAPMEDWEESCSTWSYLGHRAISCADRKAEVACRNDFSVDCVHELPEVYEVYSDTQVGYRACRAVVTVRGYKQQ